MSNLIFCLSQLVPYEPASVLRTHLSNQIQMPQNLREIASDYYMLARTRLKDLQESAQIGNPLLFAKSNSSENTLEVDQDIDKFMSTFEKFGCKEVPQAMRQMSVFNKPYFNGILIPRMKTLVEQKDTRSPNLSYLLNLLKEPKK